jgi:hypothetical protein
MSDDDREVARWYQRYDSAKRPVACIIQNIRAGWGRCSVADKHNPIIKERFEGIMADGVRATLMDIPFAIVDAEYEEDNGIFLPCRVIAVESEVPSFDNNLEQAIIKSITIKRTDDDGNTSTLKIDNPIEYYKYIELV